MCQNIVKIKRFLTTSPYFSPYFDDSKAEVFVKHFRHGILHQGEIKKQSKVTTSSKKPLVSWDKNKEEMIINRRLFHPLLIKEFNRYQNELRKKENGDIRNNFLRKMYYICRDNRYKQFKPKLIDYK